MNAIKIASHVFKRPYHSLTITHTKHLRLIQRVQAFNISIYNHKFGVHVKRSSNKMCYPSKSNTEITQKLQLKQQKAIQTTTTYNETILSGLSSPLFYKNVCQHALTIHTNVSF